MRYKPEITFVDKDGKKYPAKITGYTLEGTVAQNPSDPYNTVSAKDVKLDGIKTLAYSIDNKEGEVVEIKEFRALKERIHGKPVPPPGQPDPDANYAYTPYLSVLVNYGNNKRGEIWRSVENVTFRDFLALRRSSAPKQTVELLAAPAPTQSKGK